MKHDELLKKIQSEYELNKHFRDEPRWKPFAALRVVVELHKGIIPKGGGINRVRCTECGFAYPCPTIQAIEKELT